MAAEEVVGGIVGFLRLDADDFHREITRAIAEVKVLKGMDARVKVEATGVRRTERDLLKVGAAAKAVDRNVVGMNKSFGGGGGMFGPQVVVGGLVAGMTLLGPLTGAVTAAMGGFVGVVGTGVLAYRGFKKEIEDGTALGQAMQSEIDGLTGAFTALGTTAARAMATDVLGAMRDFRDFLPTINDEVGALGGSLGRAFRISTGGLIAGLQNAMPLLQDGGRYAEILAQKFADFAQSQDFKDFVDYARRELPGVGAAIISLAGGVKDLAVALAPAGDSLVQIINVTGKFASAMGTVIGWLDKASGLFSYDPGQHGVLGEMLGAKDAADQAAPAVATTATQMANLAAVQSPLASGLGTTNAALRDAADKHAATATKAADATLQMQLEGDAAGLLKQQLDILNGKSLNLSQAQTTAASATLGLTKSFKDNGMSLALNTTQGVENRQAIERKVAADQALAEATAKATGSTEKGTASLKNSKTALEDTLRSQGKLTPAVQAYIDKLYAVKDVKVPPTKLEVETKTALEQIKAFQKAIDDLHGKSVTAGVRYVYTGTKPGGGRSTAGGQTFDAGADGGLIMNGIRKFSGGGMITGPGTGTSDSILARIAGTGEPIRVANGEYISTAASQRRNRAALEAGNKGATLGVVGQGATEITNAPVNIYGGTFGPTLAEVQREAEQRRKFANLTAGSR